ncbi:pre-16S rRNA-processing nuclease YqgF [Merismopedia glauca]|uniref:Resolvase n=1 Tax=Merismopedia glauca CCAP 1448/3 TaxID=1296344 RepID=A0A2T1C510_9CYAN|nr:pre-16S rRNA-processing nuclease YqgF [Merismopedia glauca]PSB03248.1 resolvase [Merismopedia glauca CCAP 1448/3]
MLLGFDPGKDKCGVAILETDGKIIYHQVISSPEAVSTLQNLSQKFQVTKLVMGNQTTAKTWEKRLKQEMGNLPIILIDERYSTLEARDRYWQMYPPQGLIRLVPQGMREPPRPIDDIVAIILLERYLVEVRSQDE